GDARHEAIVDLLVGAPEEGTILFPEGLRRVEHQREAAAADLLRLQAPAGVQLLHDHLAGEDADGPGDRGGGGDDAGGVGEDVVAAAPGDGAHDGDDGLLLADAGDLAADEVAREGGAAAGVDEEDDGAGGVVGRGGAQGADDG